MNFALFGVRNVKPDESPKKQELSETSLNLRCAVHVVDTSHGMSHRKQIFLRDPQTKTTRHNALLSEARLEIRESPIV